MPSTNVPHYAFNRGEISPLAMARVDIERGRLAAETMLNFWPRTLGPMSMRPGLIYDGATDGNNAAQLIEFIAGTTDTALLELTASKMRVWLSGTLLTRPSVSTAITNDDFSHASNGWSDDSTNGASRTMGGGDGLELLTSNAGGVAKVSQTVTVAGGDQNTEHGLKIVVPTSYDPVYFRCGSAAGDDDYIAETRLLAGQHHLAFTPTGNFHLTFWAKDRYGAAKRVSSCEVETGDVDIVTPWTANDLDNIQYDQSADVIFVACSGIRQKRIERRGTRSWSVTDYWVPDGPFIGKTADIQIKPAAATGRTTLTADQDFFENTHDNALFRLYHNKQQFRMDIAGDNIFTDPIRVSGVEGTNYNERAFAFTIAGTWSGTLKTQRSVVGEDEGFGEYPRDAGAATTVDITGNTTYNNEDEDDNLIAWYRMGFEDGDYTSGVAQITVDYEFGGGYGIARVVDRNSATEVDVEVVRPFRNTVYTGEWLEGAWSEIQGFPTAVALFEGRLWWAAGQQIWASVSDNYESFDQETEGDSGPIIKVIGEGPVDAIHWLLGLERLFVGTAGAELVCKASSIETPMTPTNFSIKPSSTYGSKQYFRAIRLDEAGIFVGRDGKTLYQLTPGEGGGFVTTDLTLLHPDILGNGNGVVSMAVMRHPETRLFLVLTDGSCAVLTYERAENVIAWSRMTTTGASGLFERVAVLPTGGDDIVYFVVKRTINSATVRHIEHLADIGKADGDTESYLSDASVYLSGLGGATTLTPGTYLQGESVVVWADGNVIEEVTDGVYTPKTYTVDGSGQIDISTEKPSGVNDAVVGLSYTAQWKSVKLAYAAGGGTALSQRKKIDQLSLVLGKTHHRGVQFGPDFTRLSKLSQVLKGEAIAEGTIHSAFDAQMEAFRGTWEPDARLCLQGQSPYPAEILAAVMNVHTSG